MSQPAMSLFVVERRLPRISEHQLEVLQTALTGAASRFNSRGDGVRYLSSIFLAHTDRVLSLFVADSAETVRALNEAALIPFASIEPAVELPGPDSNGPSKLRTRTRDSPDARRPSFRDREWYGLSGLSRGRTIR